MGRFGKAVLYTALAVFANAAAADVAALERLREGDMRKLVFHAAPVAVPEIGFSDLDGADYSLEDFRGRWVLLNFWATWCAPCRKEMPMLANLQTDFGGPDFAVVTIAAGRNAPQAITRFFEEEGVDNLPSYIDPKLALASRMGVMGLPVTIILDPEGREVARMMGEATWDGDSARAILRTLIERGTGD
jgi:thiol-disulfide isomerase/thioredoxin